MIRRKPTEPTGVALFHSTSLAIRGERIARKGGLKVKLVPTPRHLSSDCGTALRFRMEDIDALRALFRASSLECDDMIPL
ncbi:MAG: DUF3343 domain-containing protein [Thermoplasmata archaeon]|nr:DUF3343 domain-containing protein [Thermoplasmata archaeon]